MRHIPTWLSLAFVLAACAGNTPDEASEPSTAEAELEADEVEEGEDERAETPTRRATRKKKKQPLDPLRNRPDLPEDERVLILVDGERRYVPEDVARGYGYGVVSLRDDWTPFIFQPMKGEDGQVLENRYRRIFIGLANDELDEDGRPLPKNERNFLEVFGIPPSISIVRNRTVRDADAECHKAIDYDLIAQLDRMTYRSDAKERRQKYKIRRYKKALTKAMKKAEVDTYAALLEVDDKWKDEVEDVERWDLEKGVLAEVEKRLECDGHNHKRYKHKKGQLDRGLRLAIRRFQRKHKIYEHTNLRGKTMRTFAKTPAQTNFDSFRRALTERVVAAAGIIEDGTTHVGEKRVTYLGKDGERHEVRDLVTEFTDATLKQLGIDTPEKLLAFFREHPEEDFEWLRIGVKFPKRPEYYSDHMELDIVVDRGDVWYDPPWNEDGKKVYQRRARMPKFMVYTTYNGERFRLVRWPTTVGGWRAEQAANGYEYFKYKGSDTGKRVIRKIIAGPVWVPPESTPLRSLAKYKYINGKRQGVVNYNEMGPGYLSAYGLVAGYFVIPRDSGRDYDRGIRAHGSSDYMSIRSEQRFSHGCHRLHNHSAVRLYGFVLNHRTHRLDGDQSINHDRQFLMNDGVFHVRILTRGFQYQLDPPLAVNVLEGRIKGRTSRPIEEYVKIPGKQYPDDTAPNAEEGGPDSRSGGGADDEDA